MYATPKNTRAGRSLVMYPLTVAGSRVIASATFPTAVEYSAGSCRTVRKTRLRIPVTAKKTRVRGRHRGVRTCRGMTTSVMPSPWSSGLSAPTGSRQATMSTTSRTTVRPKTKISIRYLH